MRVQLFPPGPFERFAWHLGAFAEHSVWRLTCRTTRDRLAELEEFAQKSINRAGLEVNITALVPAANDRPVES